MNRKITQKPRQNRTQDELLEEIERLGGQYELNEARSQLYGLKQSVVDALAVDPKVIGITTENQMQAAVAKQFEELSTKHLEATIVILRRKAGYVLLAGKYWVHRAVFTFGVWTVIVALGLPICLALIFSTMAWGWTLGLAGAVGLVGLGCFIHKRIRA